MNNHIDPKPIAPFDTARPSSLTDRELLSRIPALVSRERSATAALVAHLAELEARRLHLGQGCSSMFAYCVQVLHFSECEAYARIEGARVARRFPVVLEMLRRGEIHLSGIGLLSPCLTPKNHLELLTAARHKTKREIERMAADLRPRPTVSDAIRRLPELRASHDSPPVAREASASPPADGVETTAADCPEGPRAPSAESRLTQSVRTERPAARRSGVEPLGGERWKVQFTASSDVLEKLRLAQDLLRHQLPDGDLDRVFDRALSALVEQLMRSKVAATIPRRAPRSASGSHARLGAQTAPQTQESPVAQTGRSLVPAKRSRRIPAEVRRQVWRRDAGVCAYVGEQGRPCRARGFLEFHHVMPYARGGDECIENIQLRCRAHNQYESDLAFATGSGPSWSRTDRVTGRSDDLTI